MSTTAQKLEALFSKVRALSPQQQERVLEALSDITDTPYQLSDEELAVLLPELEGARRGETASPADVDAALNESWGGTPRR